MVRPGRPRTRPCPEVPGSVTQSRGPHGAPLLFRRHAHHLSACAVRRPQCACLLERERSHAPVLSRRLAPAKPRQVESTERMVKDKEEVEQESRGRERHGKKPKKPEKTKTGGRENHRCSSEFLTLTTPVTENSGWAEMVIYS